MRAVSRVGKCKKKRMKHLSFLMLVVVLSSIAWIERLESQEVDVLSDRCASASRATTVKNELREAEGRLLDQILPKSMRYDRSQFYDLSFGDQLRLMQSLFGAINNGDSPLASHAMSEVREMADSTVFMVEELSKLLTTSDPLDASLKQQLEEQRTNLLLILTHIKEELSLDYLKYFDQSTWRLLPPNTNLPNRSDFPEGWSDAQKNKEYDDRIKSAISYSGQYNRMTQANGYTPASFQLQIREIWARLRLDD